MSGLDMVWIELPTKPLPITYFVVMRSGGGSLTNRLGVISCERSNQPEMDSYATSSPEPLIVTESGVTMRSEP